LKILSNSQLSMLYIILQVVKIFEYRILQYQKFYELPYPNTTL